MNRCMLCGLCIFCASAVHATASAQQGSFAIRAAAYVDVDGKLQTGGVLVINDGKIERVVAQAPADLAVVVYDGAVVSPGLIDVSAALGAFGNLSESAAALAPDVNARDAFDRYHPQLRRALEAGVTTFALVPSDENLIGGRIAICQTSGPDGKPTLLSDSGPLKLSLSPAAFKPDREPTSRAGAIAMLRATLAKDRSSGGNDDSSDVLGRLVGGKLPAIMTAPSGADVLVALELAKAHGLKLTLVHNADARAIAADMATAGVGVIVGPYDVFASPRRASAAGVFDQAGVAVVIAGGLPERTADSLRTGAAVAARNGLSLAAARRAITSGPAAVLGVGEKVGSIAPGRQADLVVFSGDPLDLRSRVVAVYVQGRRVFAGQTK